MKMITTIRHKSTGNLFEAEIYSPSFVYLIDEMRTISFEDFNSYFEVVTSN